MSAQTPATTAAVLVACYESDDGDGVVAAVSSLSDEVRGEAWATLSQRLSAAFRAKEDRLPSDALIKRTRARALLALAVGPADVVPRLGSWVIGPPESDLDVVLASRSPAWRKAFVEAAVRSWATYPSVGLLGPIWWDWWRWLRRQEHLGTLPVDAASSDYLVVMVRGLMFSGSIVDAVREDPELARGPIWSLFQPASNVQRALLGSERYWNPSNTWRVALVRLALAGVIERERLAQAATAAAESERMGRGHRAWYRRIPELLADPPNLPVAPDHGPPPPGNQLYPRR